MKQTTWVVLGWLVLGGAAHAASFDCGKASTKVEHIICDNAEISKLDEELNAAYKVAVQVKQQADAIKQAQKQWVKERNACDDKACVGASYQARIGKLTTAKSSTDIPQQSAQPVLLNRKFAREADKAEGIMKILSNRKFIMMDSFCNTFLEDFRQMRGIQFEEAVAKSDRYDDPAWEPYKARCAEVGMFEDYYCEPRIAEYLAELPESEQHQEMKVACSHYQCTENFKHFRLSLKRDEGNRSEDIFYCERSRGPLNRQGRDPSDTHGGFRAIDLKQCRNRDGVHTNDSYSYTYRHPLENYNGIVRYKERYYIFNLYETNEILRPPEQKVYALDVYGYVSNEGKQQSVLSPICMFSAAPTPERKQ